MGGVNDLSLMIGNVYQSTQCSSFVTIPHGQKGGKNNNGYQSNRLNPSVCPETGAPFKIGGPLWLGPLHDQKVVASALDRLGDEKCQSPKMSQIATRTRLEGLLTSVSEELDTPLFYTIPGLCQGLKCTSPPIRSFKAAVINAGYKVSGYHKEPHTKMDMDHATFKSFDTNGDGVISMEEFDKGLKPKTRRKIEVLLEGGWVFDKEKWDASVARHNKYDMKEIFKQFDADGDGKLDIYEISRAFRAMGLPKRDGEKMEMDHALFKSFDTNGDGVISMEELDKGLKPKTRRKIEDLLEGGWVFDKAAWDASVARHNKYNLADIFKGFDRGGEGKIPMADFYRAFRAMGLPKRDGEKVEMDKKMFDSFDSNGDGFVTLVEFQENILPKTRKKIEMKLEEGWKFDSIKWDESCDRHKAA